MQDSAFDSSLQEFIEQNSLVLNSNQKEQIKKYYELSLKWGSRINITANLKCNSFLIENVLDPLLAFHSCKNILSDSLAIADNLKILDVGCGGGYVGLLWKIFLADGIHITLLDSDRKKINFCKQVIRELGLSNASAIQGRIEEFNNTEHYDTIVSRATFGWENFVKKCQKFLRQSGLLIYLTGHPERIEPSCLRSEYTLMPVNIKRQICYWSAASDRL